MTYLFNIVLLLDFMDFKNLNAQYMETICPIDFKITGLIVHAYRDLYIIFQVILKFYKNIVIFNFEDHRHLLWSCKYTDKLKEL